MKKTVFALALAFMMLICTLTGCGASVGGQTGAAYDSSASKESFDYFSDSDSGSSGNYGGISSAPQAPSAETDQLEMESGAVKTEAETQTAAGAISSDKIIYSAYAEIETLRFDAAIEGVYGMISRYEGFLESSSVTGNNHYAQSHGYASARSARFVIRIPSRHFDEMTGALSELGNVPYSSKNAENITSAYTDTQSRLSSFRIQEERLLDMLSKAATVEEMLDIEMRLADVRYNIESLTTQLQGWDSLINYSTVTLQISEVEEYTEQVPIHRSYWQQVGDALSDSLGGIGRFFKDLLKFLVAAAPVLAVTAVPAVIVLVLVRRALRRRRARRIAGSVPGKDETGTE